MDSEYSLLGAFIFLVAGVINQALLQKLMYPIMRESHERAKYLGRQTVDPTRVMLVMRVVNFILLPILGFFTAGSF